MNERNEENLRDLFERFVDSEQAEEAVDDIERGEAVLRRWPAPEPSGDLLARIKNEMAGRLVRSGRRHVRWFASRAAAIAAAFVIIASVWTGVQRDGGPGVASARSLIPSAIWESDNIAVDDLRLATFTAEVERLENELKSLLLDETSSERTVLDEAEIELMDLKGEFWQG